MRCKLNNWYENEFDALRIIVCKYNQGNCEVVLKNSSMFILRNKTSEELATIWEKETLKIFPKILLIGNTARNIFKICFSHLIASSSAVLILKIKH
jgi:hypothetical protein